MLAQILVQALGPELACGEPICYTVEDQEAYAEFLKMDPATYTTSSTTSSTPTPSATATPTATSTPVAHTAVVTATHTSTAPLIALENQKFSPAARHLIQSKSVDSSGIIGTRSHIISIYFQFLMGRSSYDFYFCRTTTVMFHCRMPEYSIHFLTSWLPSLSLSLTPPLTHPGTSKGGLISKEDVILALRNGSAKEGTAAKHVTTPVSVAVSSAVAVPVVAHKAVVAAVAGEIEDNN